MATQIILLERVEKLGEMGDVVSVKPGFARNYLFPQKKAMRASKDNIAYFEAQKKALQAENDNKRKTAEKQAKKIEGVKVPVIRQASEAGQLFGSVTARDIAASLSEESKETINKSMVIVNQAFKSIGLFDVDVALHPEVKVSVTVNIARSDEEAKIQAETGKALIADAAADDEPAEEQEVSQEEIEAEVEAQLAEVLEDDALEAEKEKQALAKAKEAEEAAKAQAREEERAAKKAAEEAAAAEAEAEAEAGDAEEAPAEEASEEASAEESEEEDKA